MPFYEYLCPDCNRVFTFFSQRINPEKEPTCPKCKRTGLTKVVSKFGLVGVGRKSKTGGGLGENRGPGPGNPSDSDPMENPATMREMEKLMAQAEGMDENDPRQLGQLMRRMSEITGEKMEGGMEEAIRRLEAGEDPEKVEEALGDELGEGPDGTGGSGGFGGGPSYDDGVYSM